MTDTLSIVEDLLSVSPEAAKSKLNEMVFRGQIHHYIVEDATSEFPTLKVTFNDGKEITIGRM